MTDLGDLSGTGPTPTAPTTARSGLTSGAPAAQRAAEQERLHTPPPRQRGVPPPRNPNATRRPDWTDAHTGEGKFLAAQDALRVGAANDAGPDGQTARDTGAAPGRGNGAEPKYKIGDYELTESEAASLMERHALEESRKLTMPAEPSGYALELPKDFVTPQGIEFQFFENDPAVALAREFAHKNGFSQEQFSAMSAIYATTRIQEITALKAMFSAAVVQGFEKLMSHVSSQGSGSYSNTGREPPKSSSEIPGYATMTFEQRRAAQERGAGRR